MKKNKKNKYVYVGVFVRVCALCLHLPLIKKRDWEFYILWPLSLRSNVVVLGRYHNMKLQKSVGAVVASL